MNATMTLHNADQPIDPGGAGTSAAALAPWWRRRPPAQWAGLALLAAWGGFWVWFVTFDALAEGMPSLVPALSIGLSVAAVTLTPWKWPRVGGVLAMLGAIAAALVFRGASAWALMATPPAVGGLLVLWGARSRRC